MHSFITPPNKLIFASTDIDNKTFHAQSLAIHSGRPWVAGQIRTTGNGDGLLSDWSAGLRVPIVSSRFSWHDLFPWQPLPPSIHGHLSFQVVHEKLVRSCKHAERHICAQRSIDGAACACSFQRRAPK